MVLSLTEILIFGIYPKCSVKTQSRLTKCCRTLAINTRPVENEEEMKRKKRIVHLRKYNPLWDIINAYPYEKWDINAILYNPNTIHDLLLTWNKKNPIQMEWEVYSNNVNLNWNIVKEYIWEEWDWCKILMKSWVTPEIVKKILKIDPTIYTYPVELNGDKSKLMYMECCNQFLYADWQTVFHYESEDHSIDIMDIIAKINYIDAEIIEQIQQNNFIDRLGFYYPLILKHPTNYAQYFKIYEIVQANIQLVNGLQCADACLENPFIFLEIVDKNPDLNWNFAKMHTMANHLTINFVIKFINKNWDFPKLTRCRNIVSTEVILTYHNLDWDAKYFCKHYPLTIQDLREKTFPWNHMYLSMNASFTWQMIEQNSDLDWELDGFCLNPNLSLSIIQKNKLTKWDFTIISRNKFGQI